MSTEIARIVLAPLQLAAALILWLLFLLFIGLVWLLLLARWAFTGIRS